VRFLISLFILTSTAYSADFTTYVGPPILGQSAGVAAIATDSAGNIYVTGSNASYTYITGLQAFVTKLDPNGNIVFNVSLGPGWAYAIAVDPAGNVWVGGQDLGLPLVNPLQSTPVGNSVGSLVKLAPDGTVVYASFFGGTLGSSSVNGVATDQSGNVYVTGWTGASDFPTTSGLPASPVAGGSSPVYGLFAAKLNSTGQKILYSTVIAGAANCATCFVNVPKTIGAGIAIDGAGNALVAGNTNAALPAVTATGGSGAGAFVFKINAAGDQVVYFTYVGSSDGNSISPNAFPTSITADAAGSAYVAGQANNQGFAAKLSPAGSIVWNTPLGGSIPSMANGISLDSSDNVWLTASTGTIFAPGASLVDELSADGSDFLNSEEFPTGEAGQGIAVDQSGTVHFAGSLGLVSTLTPTQPLGPRALSIVSAASGQLLGTIAPGEIISIYGLGLAPTAPAAATPENGLYPTSLGGVQVLVNGTPIPLLYVSASQINAEIPSGIASGRLGNGLALVQITYTEIEMTPLQQISFMVTLPDFSLAIVGSEFAVFENPGGSMAVINQDGTLNKIANPAPPGSTVSIWATGFGATAPPADGAVATAANNYCSSCQLTLSNGPHSITETVQYAGTSPGLIDGLMQINFMIPTGFPFNGAFVYLTTPGSTQSIQLGWVNISQ
jgi:uncharacterized protein (TIGR03437 family)